VSGTWGGSIRDTLNCNPCRALYGLSLQESSDGAITGTVAADIVFEHDAVSAAARVNGVRRADTVDLLFISVSDGETERTRQGITGVIAPDLSSIRGELWFTPDSTVPQHRPIVLVRAELDSALLTILSDAKLR
jgi:hypothetical protein